MSTTTDAKIQYEATARCVPSVSTGYEAGDQAMTYEEVYEHIDNAIDELREARDKSDPGTSMRLTSVIATIRRLRGDIAIIHDDED